MRTRNQHQTIHLWATGNTPGDGVKMHRLDGTPVTVHSGASVWAEGDTIYSYATPVAQFATLGNEQVILFNGHKYSDTTSCHQTEMGNLLHLEGHLHRPAGMD